MSRDKSIAEATQRGWYVLQTKRHRERIAQRYLEEIGVSSYLPRILQWPRPAVGSAVVPMFPGYVFVHATLSEDFTRIIWTPGVKAFVSFGGAPAEVDASIIEFLCSRQGPDGLVHCASPIHEGSEIRIIAGPFRGLTAVVEQRLPARERVRVLMDLLQRPTRVELPERWIARA